MPAQQMPGSWNESIVADNRQSYDEQRARRAASDEEIRNRPMRVRPEDLNVQSSPTSKTRPTGRKSYSDRKIDRQLYSIPEAELSDLPRELQIAYHMDIKSKRERYRATKEQRDYEEEDRQERRTQAQTSRTYEKDRRAAEEAHRYAEQLQRAADRAHRAAEEADRKSEKSRRSDCEAESRVHWREECYRKGACTNCGKCDHSTNECKKPDAEIEWFPDGRYSWWCGSEER